MSTSKQGMRNLPTELICNIISQLPTRDVVRFSVLFKKWKRVWLSLVNWRFESSDYSQTRPEAEQEFNEFINDVIFFHTGSGIAKLSINLQNHGAFQRPAVLWMNHIASQKKITELDLDIGGPVIPPVGLFCCTSLVKLRLVLHNARLNIPTEVQLNSLKELFLQDVKFAESGDAQRLVDGCRTLNKLEFNGCTGNALYDMHLIINLPDLKVFRFHSSSGYIFVQVAAMNLEEFTFTGRNVTMSEGVDFSFLKEVSLNEFQFMEQYRIFNRRVPVKKSANKMLQTVSSLKMAEKLCLGQWCIEHLSNIPQEVNLPTFENLMRLSVDFWPIEYHANVVLQIMKCSPNLQHLYAKTCPTTRIDITELLHDEVHLHLKSIEMDSFTGSKVEMWLVEKLLGSCPQLTELNINFRCELEESTRKAVISGVCSSKKLSPALTASFL